MWQNILAEATFVCPSYWMATAFTAPNKQAYHYQYSVPFAAHRADVTAYVGPATPNQGPEFTLAIRSTHTKGHSRSIRAVADKLNYLS
jgi:hypothetical protein